MKHLSILAILAAIFLANTAFAAPAPDVQSRIFSYFLDRAEKGDSSAQFIVGFRLESGSGTERDMKKAMEWYGKAAAQGHEQARERIGMPATPPAAVALASAPVAAAQTAAALEPKAVARTEKKKTPEVTKPTTKSATKPGPAAVHTTAPVTKHPETPHKTVTTTASAPVPRPSPILVPAAIQEKPASSTSPATEPAANVVITAVAATNTEMAASPVTEKKVAEPPAINTLEVVLGSRWARNEVAPDYLPSRNTSCLRAGGEKIICFSGGAQASVDGNAVMYAVKSTLSDFEPNGGFRVRYVFNVTDVAADTGASNADSRDLFGLAAKLGWQEPGIALDCSVNESGGINCTRNGRQQMTFYRQ